MNKTLLVGAVAVVALVLSGVAYFRPPTLVEREVVRDVVRELGAAPGNELPGPVVKFGGSPLIGLYMKGNTGTTTPCVFDVRPYASSTIVSIGATIQGVPTTTGNYWGWYKGVGFSSTTQLARRAVTATGTAVFATTTRATDAAIIGSGDNFLVLDFNGGSQPYLGMGGQTVECSALLLSPSSQ